MKANHLKLLSVLLVLGIFLLSGCTEKIVEPDQPIIKEPDEPVEPDLKDPEEPVTGTLEIEPILLSGLVDNST